MHFSDLTLFQLYILAAAKEEVYETYLISFESESTIIGHQRRGRRMPRATSLDYNESLWIK